MKAKTVTGSFIGPRSSNVEQDRDTWTTPRDIARALGPVWLDPCSNPRSKIQATKTFMLDRGQDGLELARYVPRDPPAPVFINPPYSRQQVIRWVNAYGRTRFVFLLRFDPSTEWFRRLLLVSSAICVPLERVAFDPPPGIVLANDNHNNPFPHALYYRDAADVTPAMKRLCTVLLTENKK